MQVVGTAPPDDFAVLDLGCGTGLCAPLFRTWARRLVGVDLAPKMIEQARQRGLYDELILGDVLVPLHQPDSGYDLIIAADVFVYIGNIEAIIKAGKMALSGRGYFAFSTELHHGPEDFVLRTTGRYAQSPQYIERLAVTNGFKILRRKTVMLRKDVGAPIEGDIYVLAHA
jgi:predicted TPR repeat methyltransferase